MVSLIWSRHIPELNIYRQSPEIVRDLIQNNLATAKLSCELRIECHYIFHAKAFNKGKDTEAEISAQFSTAFAVCHSWEAKEVVY